MTFILCILKGNARCRGVINHGENNRTKNKYGKNSTQIGRETGTDDICESSRNAYGKTERIACAQSATKRSGENTCSAAAKGNV